jgi:hypothetical protein
VAEAAEGAREGGGAAIDQGCGLDGGTAVYEREWRRRLNDLRDEIEMHRWGEETG